jgi:uncharacterized protein
MSYLVPVNELMRRPGTMRELELDFVATEAIGTEIVSVPKGASLRIPLRLEAVYEGVLATGEIFAEADTECSRCLKELKIPVEVDFQELFAYSLTSDDELLVVNEQIDLEQLVIDSVVLNLPFQPVCSPDCLGLCAECGIGLNENPEHKHQAPIDSRFGALKDFAIEEE